MVRRTRRPKKAKGVEHRLPQLWAQAALKPGTFTPPSEEGGARVEAVLNTGRRMLRVPWFDDPFYEQLVMEPAAVRLERFSTGRAPVSKDHDLRVDNTVGRIERAWLDDGLHAGLEFGSRESIQDFLTDVESGVIANLSIGYHVLDFEEETEELQDGFRIFRAVLWEPHEVSFVGAGADMDAHTASLLERGESREDRAGEVWRPCLFRGVTMAQQTTKKKASKKKRAARAAVRPADVTDEDEPVEDPEEVEEEEVVEDEPVEDPEAAADDDDAEDEEEGDDDEPGSPAEATLAERRRVLSIQRACRLIPDKKRRAALRKHLIHKGKSASAARARICAELERSQPNMKPVHVEREEGDATAAAIENAMLVRARVRDPKTGKPHEYSQAGLQYRGARLLTIGEAILRLGGERLASYSPAEIARRALAFRSPRTASSLGSSDFPTLLQNVVNKMVLAEYGTSDRQTFREFGRQRNPSDYKTVTTIILHGGDLLEPLPEDAEITFGKMSESGETWALVEHAKNYRLTRKAIIDDDASAFDTLPRAFIRNADRLESNIVWSLIVSNPTLSDGFALFDSTNHGNDVSSADLDTAGVGLVRVAMLRQQDADGNPIQPEPVHLRVPPELETEARQLTSSDVVPGEEGKANVWRGSFRSARTESRLVAANQWYAFADPNDTPVVEYGTLAGEMGPRITVAPDVTTTGVVYTVEHDFGAGIVAHHGAVRATTS